MQSSGSTPLAVVTQIEPITVIFTLSQDNLEQVLAQMRHGNTLSVEAWDRTQESKIGTGKLTALDNQIDTTTGTLKLRAMFDNKQDTLFPNQFVNTRLLVETEHNMTLIPTGAIQHNGDEAFVYLIENGKKPNEKIAKIQDVKPGTANEGLTAVTGINPGDMVATSSFESWQRLNSQSFEDGSGTVRRKREQYPVSPSRPFILRPVATSLLMAAILLVGIVAFTQLPVSALPEVDYPTIQVLTFYPGASPNVMATTVTAPLERQFGQMQGLSQMTSTSSGGTSVIVLQFDLA